jgi:hypothetical protein
VVFVIVFFRAYGESVAKFKYLVTAMTNQSRIHEGIKSRLYPGEAWYRSVQNLLSSRLLSKNIKIKIYRTIIFSVVFCGCETWYLILQEEHRVKVLIIGC